MGCGPNEFHQLTERGPLLDLDFTKGVLPIDVNYTRSGAATVTNKSGLITPVLANEPRFDYDPVTLASKGMLIETSATNSIKFSEEIDNVYWPLTGSYITPDLTNAPSGKKTADKFVEGVNFRRARPYCENWFGGQRYSYSLRFFAKAAERKYLIMGSNTRDNVFAYAVFDISAGTTKAFAGNTGNFITSTIQDVGNGWYRCSIVNKSGTNGNIYRFIISMADTYNPLYNRKPFIVSPYQYHGDGKSGLYLWGAQFEVGTFATSYISTSSKATTRSADQVSMSNLNWFTPEKGTITATVSQLELRPQLRTSTNSVYELANLSAVAGRDFILSFQRGVSITNRLTIRNKIAGGYNGESISGAANNEPVKTVNDITKVTRASSLLLGKSSGADYLNGHIEHFTFYPFETIGYELQRLTK